MHGNWSETEVKRLVVFLIEIWSMQLSFFLQVNACEFPISSSDYVFQRGKIFVLAYILI